METFLDQLDPGPQENLKLLTTRDLLGMTPGKDLDVRLTRNRFPGLPNNLVLVIARRAPGRPPIPAGKPEAAA